MISFLASVALPLLVYFFIQSVLLIIVNKVFLRNKLKFQEIINIAVISSLLVSLTLIPLALAATSLLAYFLFYFFILGIGTPVTVGLILVLIFIIFHALKKSISPYVKNISFKAARNLCIFIMLFNIILVFSFVILTYARKI